MSRRCDTCDRKPLNMVSRSHSHIATKRRQHLNLQVRHLGGKKVRMCVRCIKTEGKTSTTVA